MGGKALRGKHNKINNLRIIGQNTKDILCPINSVK